MMASDTITIQLTITAAEGAPRVPLEISRTITPSELRNETSRVTKIPLSSLKLIFRGRLITEDNSKSAVAEFKLEDGSVIHCMGKPDASTHQQTEITASSTSIPTLSILPTAAASLPSAPAQPSYPADPLKVALQTLRTSNPPASYQSAINMLEKMINNIIDNPMEEKYRRVKKQNPAFQKRLGGLPGGDNAMKAAGFICETHDNEEVYLLNASADAWPTLLKNKSIVEMAARELKSSNPSAGSIARQDGNSLFGTSGGTAVPNFMPPVAGGMPSGDQLTQFLSDPNAIQTMMQNPMVQTMLRNDPRFSGNPMIQNMIQELANNPQVASQMSQMMRDPALISQMQQMHALQGGNPSFTQNANNDNATNPMDPASMERMAQMMQHLHASRGGFNQQGRSNTQNQAPSGGENDVETTEEEMIAEAIRRSLQDS